MRGRQPDAVATSQRELPSKGLRHDHLLAADRPAQDRCGLPFHEEIPTVPRMDQQIPGNHSHWSVVVVHADIAVAVRRHNPGQRLQPLGHGLRQGPFRAVAQPRRRRDDQVCLHGLLQPQIHCLAEAVDHHADADHQGQSDHQRRNGDGVPHGRTFQLGGGQARQTAGLPGQDPPQTGSDRSDDHGAE